LRSFGVKEPALAMTPTRWDNRPKKIAIELGPTQSERLKSMAASLGVNAEELAQAAVTDLASAGSGDLEPVASRVL